MLNWVAGDWDREADVLKALALRQSESVLKYKILKTGLTCLELIDWIHVFLTNFLKKRSHLPQPEIGQTPKISIILI